MANSIKNIACGFWCLVQAMSEGTGVSSKLSLEGGRKEDFVPTLPTMLPEALQGQKQAEYSRNQELTATTPRLT